MGGSYDGPLSCGSAGLGSIEGRYNDSGWPTPWCSKLCMIRYHSSRPADTALRGRLRNLGNERRCFGYRRLFVLLRREGEPSGINRIYRPYREEGLTVRKRAGLPQSCGDPCPDPGRGEAQRALVAGLRPRPVRQRPALPHPSTSSTTSPRNAWVRFRRRRSRGRARGPRTGGNRRATRQARNDRVRPWHRVHLQRHAAAQKSSWMSLSRSPIWMRRPG